MRVQIEYELRFAAPFHFGTGIRAGLVDRTVIRDAGGYLYVPASTFKGVLREYCEHLYAFYVKSDAPLSPHDAYAALADFSGTPNLISRIFGSSINPGTLFFRDAKQSDSSINAYEEDIYKDAQINLLTQVRIDRQTRTAVSEALYTSEFGQPALTFAGSIKGQLDSAAVPDLVSTISGYSEKPYTLTPTYALLLLLAGILLIEKLGGNKSTGKGQCTCAITNLKLDSRDCSEIVWREWIERLDVLSDYQPEAQGEEA